MLLVLQNVTLGGTGKEVGDRHPKISDNVLIGACATVLGNITIGKGAQIAAGSLVLKPVPPHYMVAGSPAKEVGKVTGEGAGGGNRSACVVIIALALFVIIQQKTIALALFVVIQQKTKGTAEGFNSRSSKEEGAWV